MKLKSLILLLFLSCPSTLAQQQLKLPAPALWLEPVGEALGLLLENGDVMFYDGETISFLEHGWAGNNLLSCGEHLIGVDENGLLASAGQYEVKLKVATSSRPLCLSEDRLVVLSEDATVLYLLDPNLNLIRQQSVLALPDAELTRADLNGNNPDEIILLTDPTERYPHGVLGDALEASSISVFDGVTLEPIASYELDMDYVFEQRRVTPFAFGSKTGLLATRSSAKTGAGVILLALEDAELSIIAEAPPIGQGNRWLNLFASRNGTAYAIRTPHIGGPIQRYSYGENELFLELFQLGVTNHFLGSRNLDMSILLPRLENGGDQLVFLSQDLHSLQLVKCEQAGCIRLTTYPLLARLNSNLASFSRGDIFWLAAADQHSNLWLWPLD